MELIIASVLAVIQGITEFLPISSSAHLILPAQLFDIHDQGLMFDTAVHGGTLLAVTIYFRKDILAMLAACSSRWRQPQAAEERRVAFFILLGSIPVLASGYFFYDFISTKLRSVEVIAATTIAFGILLWLASRGIKAKQILSPWVIVLCGVCQIFALVPGVSRSGITITFALFAGYTPQSAARLSFLLSLPVIGAAFLYGILRLVLEGEQGNLFVALWGGSPCGIVCLFNHRNIFPLVGKSGNNPVCDLSAVVGGWLDYFYYAVAVTSCQCLLHFPSSKA